MDQKEIMQIIRDNDLNINLTKDDFYIVEGWDDLNKFEALINNISDVPAFQGLKQLTPNQYIDIDKVLINWGFSDEYSICNKCDNHIHLISYDMIDYAILNSELICGDCIRDNDNDFKNEYIETLITNSKKANTILKDNDLENLGFIKCNCNNEECDFSAGLREGKQDKPEDILKNAIAKNPGYDFIFDITNIDMFETRYTIWRRPKNED